jgi:hypothetical protein
METNEQFCRELATLVIDQILGRKAPCGEVQTGPLEINDFSICFGIDFLGDHSPKGFYVKIPKADLYKKEKRDIFPLTDDDRRFAEEEYQSLAYLSQCWDSRDLNVEFVKPVGFIKEYNAIVTEKVYATDLFKLFRRRDLIRRLNSDNKNDSMHSILFRIGAALYRFHQNSIKEVRFNPNKMVSKVDNYCSLLKTFGTDHNFLDSIIVRLLKFEDYMPPTHIIHTLKGLDLRNILIDKEKKLFMLDPGKMKENYIEADLARFLVTCRILYWGSVVFFSGICPDGSYEESFLRGYYGGKERNNKLLAILIIKELFKHWLMAYEALELKKWSGVMKYMVRKIHIDQFYKRQLASEIAGLER